MCESSIKEGLRHKESRLEQAIKESEGLSSSLPDEPSRVEQYIKDIEREKKNVLQAIRSRRERGHKLFIPYEP